MNTTYDRTGKMNMNYIYNRPDPLTYFSTLSELDYRIPQEAKPHFQQLIKARRSVTKSETAKVVDLGCSYGVNSALLKHGFSMDELYRLYASVSDPEVLLARDRELYAEPADPRLEMVGVDLADRAVSYAVEAGTLDAGVVTDLEMVDPTPEDAATLENADLVISTGCVGYVSEVSLERLLLPSLESRPWMAHFVLRMFDFGASEEMLARHGYVTEKIADFFPQRRFVSAEEQQQVLDNLERMGIDATGIETTGWYFAELHVARPQEVVKAIPIDRVLDNSGLQIA